VLIDESHIFVRHPEGLGQQEGAFAGVIGGHDPQPRFGADQPLDALVLHAPRPYQLHRRLRTVAERRDHWRMIRNYGQFDGATLVPPPQAMFTYAQVGVAAGQIKSKSIG